MSNILIIIHSRANKIPLITWLVDAYTIDRAKYHVEHNKILSISEWALTINPFMKDLHKSKSTIWKEVVSAMEAYTNRILRRLIFSPRVNIDDSINQIVNYVACFPKFISTLISRKDSNISPPFCVCHVICSACFVSI